MQFLNFKKRLKYENYRGIDNIITIDLHNNYSIIAIIGEDKLHTYNVELWIKKNTINKWDLIDNAQNLTFNANSKTIYSAMLKQVSTFLDEGFFDYYIQRYEYEMDCFDKGNDLYERERLGDTNIS